jgi:hypothetical protein
VHRRDALAFADRLHAASPPQSAALKIAKLGFDQRSVVVNHRA